MVDPLHHPDLGRLSRQLRSEMDDTLEAEQHAAMAVHRRRRTLRDLLLDAEDRGRVAVVSATDGQLYRGSITAVGADHVILDDEARERVVALSHIVGLEVH